MKLKVRVQARWTDGAWTVYRCRTSLGITAFVKAMSREEAFEKFCENFFENTIWGD